MDCLERFDDLKLHNIWSLNGFQFQSSVVVTSWITESFFIILSTLLFHSSVHSVENLYFLWSNNRLIQGILLFFANSSFDGVDRMSYGEKIFSISNRSMLRVQILPTCRVGNDNHFLIISSRSVNEMSFGFKIIWRWEKRDLTRFSSNSTASSRLVTPTTQIGAWFDWAESKRLYSRFWLVWSQNKWKSSKMKITLRDCLSRPHFKQVSRNPRCSANEPNSFLSVSSSNWSCFVIDFNAMVSLVSTNPCSRTITTSVSFGLLMIECSADAINCSWNKT